MKYRGIRIHDLRDIISTVDLTEETTEILRDHPDILSSLRQLCHKQLYNDCIQIIAHAFDCREAILWGRDCLNEMAFVCNPKEIAVLDNVNRWLDDDREEYRVINCNGLEIAGSYSPVAWLSQAVFYSGGSIIEGDVAVEPPTQLFGDTVAAAVLIAACAGDDGLSQTTRLPLFIDLGVKKIMNLLEAEY